MNDSESGVEVDDTLVFGYRNMVLDLLADEMALIKDYKTLSATIDVQKLYLKPNDLLMLSIVS
jgi:hypothetical protein